MFSNAIVTIDFFDGFHIFAAKGKVEKKMKIVPESVTFYDIDERLTMLPLEKI